MTTAEFIPFAKIPRLKRGIVVTEKIDGTNACVRVLEDGVVLAQSRNRFITPENDNDGFAAWVKSHEEELRVGLGIGAHFGEWWGAGIQRRYGLTEKRFALFNTARWTDDVRPACCGVVPVLYAGPFDQAAIDDCVEGLRKYGSVAAPGFPTPEGVVVFHSSSGTLFKLTLEADEKPKGSQEEVAA
jgi:hypothetical protein